ncbi:MAG: TRAP transporter large permease subunit, partial [Advenella sp.]
EKTAADEVIVLNLLLWGVIAFVIAVTNKALRLQMLSQIAERVVFVMIPPLLLIFLVLGTIFLGVATPTEGGAMGAVGAIVMALLRRRLSWTLLKQAMDTTTKLTSFVVFILVGSTIFTLTFTGFGGQHWVEGLFASLPGGETGFLIVVSVATFFLAFFLDFFELAFIIVPLLGPVADKMGIDLIWFGVLLAVNMQTSFMHPPFGFALFYLRSVAPKEDYVDRITGKLIKRVTTGEIYRGSIPFIVIQLLMVASVMIWPGMVLHYKGAGTGTDPATVRFDMGASYDSGGYSTDPYGSGAAPSERSATDQFNDSQEQEDSAPLFK